MPELPPAELVFDALKNVVIPSAGAAALALGLFLVLGRWAGALGSGVAVLAGVAFANWQRETPYLPWKPEDTSSLDWLLPTAAVLVAVGLLSRWGGLIVGHSVKKAKWKWLPGAAVWVPRAAAVLLVSGWGIPTATAASEPYLPWVIATGTLLAWTALDGVARAGCSVEVVALLSLTTLCAGGVLLYAQSAKYMEIVTLLAMSLFGVAVVGGVAKANVSGAIPAALGFVPGMLATGQHLTFGKVPVGAFWLVGLAPLALLPFLVPALARRNGWAARLVRLLLVLTPLVAALWLADRHETLAFDI